MPPLDFAAWAELVLAFVGLVLVPLSYRRQLARRRELDRRLAMLRHPSNRPTNPHHQRHLHIVRTNTDRSLNR